MKKIITALFFFCSTITALAASVTVPTDYSTIQTAINNSVYGDTILVEPGTYTENLNFLGKEFHLISTGGSEVTIIQPNTPNSPTINSINQNYPTKKPNSTIRGFTFTRFVKNAPMIYFWGGSIDFSENIIRDNFSTTLRGEMIKLVSSNSKIYRNLIYDNQSSYFVAVDGDLGTETLNNTLYNNYNCYAQGIVKNNIFMNTQHAELSNSTPGTGYNNFYRESGTPVTSGNPILTEDPLFIDAAGYDFHLQKGSPMINAGDPDTIYTEIDNTIIDIGRFNRADSLLPLAQQLYVTPFKDTTMVTSLNPSFHWSYHDTIPNTQTSVQIQIGTDDDWSTAEVWSSGTISTSSPSTNYTGPTLSDRQLYYIRIRTNNGSGFGNWKDTTFFTNIAPRLFTYPTEFANIQDAFDTALDDDTILVLPGTYTENVSLSGKRINLVSNGGPELTIFEAANPGQTVISLADSPPGGHSSVSGFTTKNGRSGIRIENGSYRVSNNIISNNVNSSSPVGSGIHSKNCYNNIIENNHIFDNQTPFFGGALYLDDSDGDTVRYNLMHDNSGDPQVRFVRAYNIVYYNNTLDVGSGGGLQGIIGNTVMYNNIFVNATGDAVSGAGSPSHQISGGYNLFHNNNVNVNGTVTISNTYTGDPLFVDTASNNYFLLAPSPCINTGNPNSFYNDSDGSRNDLGALAFDTLQSLHFEIIYPPNLFNEIVYDMKPTFIWSSSIDGDINDNVTYNFTIDDSYPFTSPTVLSGLADTTLVLADSLEFSTHYYWQVVAEDEGGYENETDVKNFWTWTLGDMNHDHTIDISDLVYFVDFLFTGGPAPSPIKIGDFNSDCVVDISDIVIYVDYMFSDNGTELGIGCE